MASSNSVPAGGVISESPAPGTRLNTGSAVNPVVFSGPANPTIVKGQTEQFKATGTYGDNSTQDLTSQVTWASGTLSSATIATGADGQRMLNQTLGVAQTANDLNGDGAVNVVDVQVAINAVMNLGCAAS